MSEIESVFEQKLCVSNVFVSLEADFEAYREALVTQPKCVSLNGTSTFDLVVGSNPAPMYFLLFLGTPLFGQFLSQSPRDPPWSIFKTDKCERNS